MNSRVFGALVFTGLSLFFTSTLQAQSGIYSFLGALAIGIIPRNINDDYARKIDVDPKASVRFWNGEGLCSGTFIATDTAVTAAHCVDITDPTGGLNVEGVSSLTYAISDAAKDYLSELPANLKSLSKKEIEELNAKTQAYQKDDIAIVRFPKGTGEFLGIRRYPALAKEPLEKGAQAYAVGFGGGDTMALLGAFARGNSGDSQGIKGWGTVRIQSVEIGFYQTEPVEFTAEELLDDEKPTATKDSAVLPGDSGGSIFNVRGELVAVTSSILPHYKMEPDQSTILRTDEGFATLVIDSRLTDLTGSLSKELLDRPWSIPEDADKAPFSHSPLRSGRYTSPKINGDYLLSAAYKKGTLIEVSLRSMDRDQPGPPAVLHCSGLSCLSADQKFVLKPEGTGFTMGLRNSGLLSAIFPQPQHLFQRID